MQWHKTLIAIVSVIRQRCLQSLQVCQVHSSGKLVTSAIQIRKKIVQRSIFYWQNVLVDGSLWWDWRHDGEFIHLWDFLLRRAEIHATIVDELPCLLQI